MSRSEIVPVVGTSSAVFRRSILPMQRFQVRTRLLAIEGRNVFLENLFVSMTGDVMMQLVVKWVLLKPCDGPRGRAMASEWFKRAGYDPKQVDAFERDTRELAERLGEASRVVPFDTKKGVEKGGAKKE